MIKKDISKILTTGSIKQRLLLVAEDRARARYSKEPILTDKELNAISDSIKTSAEIKLWNKFNQLDRTVQNGIQNLQGAMFAVRTAHSLLKGYILLWNAIENAEQLANSILHEITDQEQRKKIADKVGKGRVRLIYSEIIPDEEGYLDVKIDERYSYYNEDGKPIGVKDKPRLVKDSLTLISLLNNAKRETLQNTIQFISWREALLDYMDKNSFNVKTYKELIDDFTAKVNAPIIGWDKYNSNEESFTPQNPNKRRDKLKSKYAITPNIEELVVDQDIYNEFMEILKDE